MKTNEIIVPEAMENCYNKEQKARYINALADKGIQWESIHSYIVPFVAIAKYERYYKTDILDMSKNKIATVLEMLIKSYAMYSNYCSVLKNYYRFNGKDFDKVQPDFSELDIELNMENRYVKDYSSLLSLLNEAFPLSNGSLDEFRKLTIELCFLGFKKDEIQNMEKSGVDFVHQSITYGNHVVEKVPTSCLALCEICMNMREVYLNNTAHLPESQRAFFPLHNNKYLIRSRFDNVSRNNEPVPMGWLGRVIVAFNDAIEGDFSFNSIRASGLYAWLYEKEMSGEFNPSQPRRTLEKYYEGWFKAKCSGGNLSKNYEIWKQLYYDY